MDTPNLSSDRCFISRIKLTPLLIAGFAFFVSVSVTSCFDSEVEDSPSTNSTVGANPGLSPGATLYTNNCEGCHGTVDVTTVDDPSVSAITTAIANLNVMAGVSVTADEIQAISDFLTGSSGGGTGGDTSSGPPASHTNSEDSIMHAPGNTLPFTSGCTLCHGETLAGGVGPSCFMCHGQEWNEGPGSVGGTGSGGANTSEGQALYTTYCSQCHGAAGTSLTGQTVDQITAALSRAAMNSIALSLTEIQAIADYLVAPGSTGGSDTGGSDTGGSTGGTPNGETLFADNCSLCHGTGSAINDSSVAGITSALSLSAMNSITLTADEIQAISDFLSGSTGGSDTGGSTGGTANGETLFADNCSLCHGTGSGINDPSVAGITSALSLSAMSNITLTADEIQAISDFLTGSTGGDTGGSTGGTANGETLFADNCSLCHGTGSGINDPSVAGITSALSLSAMNSITLTADEIQAISDFLTGSTGGGGTGGSDTGGSLPASHTNSEEGVFHGEGNDYPYTNGCTACHGATLQGALGPSCFACHGVEWIESAPVGGDTGGSTGGTANGDTLFADNCSLCHGTGSGINDPSVAGITSALSLSAMSSISLTVDEIQAISDFLTGSTGGGGTGGSTGGTANGDTLFADNCSLCHGTGSGINDPSVAGITSALNLSAMSNISLTTDEIQAISDFLTGSTGGGGTGGSDTGGSSGPPASHTNPEDSILHAPGNNYPYTNGCTACHGATLEGGIGPSCYACHGVEWNESAPSSDSGGSTGGSTGSTEGQALYTTYCSSCHGASGSNINGRTASAISTAIANVGSMGNISLTSAEIQAIADYLSGSTGGSTGGSSDTGGVPGSHTNSEQGVMHGPGNDYPYSSGCTSCHGSSLQGGIGPSCYNCHGVEWIESAPVSGGESDSGSEEESSE